MLRVLLGLAAFCLLSCASTKSYTLDELPGEQLIFSFGGGFTGEYNEYLLLENGQLFGRRYVATKLPFREFESVDPDVAKDLFKSYETQGLGTLGYNDPGNLTKTIQHVSKGDTTSITWGGNRVQPSEGLRSYWRRLIAATRDKKQVGAVR